MRLTAVIAVLLLAAAGFIVWLVLPGGPASTTATSAPAATVDASLDALPTAAAAARRAALAAAGGSPVAPPATPGAAAVPRAETFVADEAVTVPPTAFDALDHLDVSAEAQSDGRVVLLVSGVPGASPVADSALKPGDRIVAINGIAFDDERALIDAMQGLATGKAIRFGVLRDGRSVEMSVDPSAPR